MEYRKWLVSIIYKLWKQRNYYKYWMEYSQRDNDFWHDHFDAMKNEER